MANEIKRTDGEALSNAEDLTRREVMDPSTFIKELLGSFGPLFESMPVYADPLQSLDLFAELFSYNENGSLNVTLEVPGIKEEDLSVNIHDDGVVTVRGETKTAFTTHTVEDTFTVPEGFRLEPEHHLENGILTLTFPLVKEDSTESI